MKDLDLLDLITHCRRGSVVAPAGCGKTDQLAQAVVHSKGRRLVLTHTLAGADALRRRLKAKRAEPDNYQISTIAAWSLRLASAFPLRSGLSVAMPNGEDWNNIYAAAAKLITSGCIDSIFKISYEGFFVDEYQDCTRVQHQLVCALADLLPCCIFGDPLQAIFGFGGNLLPDWDTEVLGTFPQITKLKRPHRWNSVGSRVLGAWLLKCRDDLTGKGHVDLSGGPSKSVIHCVLAAATKEALYREKRKLVLNALNKPKGESCIIIGDSTNEEGRAALARDVRATAIEPLNCRRLQIFVKRLEETHGLARLDMVLDLVKDVMSGAEVAKLKKVVRDVAEKKRRKQLDIRQAACVEIAGSERLEPILRLLEGLRRQQTVWIYRRELYSALCAAFRMVIAGTSSTLQEAVWGVQNGRRHAGRHFAERSIGSTLLVKGLEFDHAIIVDVEKLKRNDLYVALTRASRSITVISESCVLNPAGG